MAPSCGFVVQDSVEVKDIVWKGVCVTHFDGLGESYLSL